MGVKTQSIEFLTQGFCDVIEITSEVEVALASQELTHGVVTLFVPGSTAGLTTLEYEPGCVEDLKAAVGRMVPERAEYAHNARWGDGNGFSHVRAALLGPSLQVPFSDKKLQTGTWQQLVLVDFDNRPRQRELIIQIMGE